MKELQERGAIHFHVLCVYSKPYVFPSSNEIASSWKLGFVKITAPKLRMKLNTIVGYIGKYIGKGYEYEQLEVKKGVLVPGKARRYAVDLLKTIPGLLFVSRSRYILGAD